MKILVVEEDTTLARVMEFALRHAGFEVLAAPDGLATLTSCQLNQPDLVLLDVNSAKLDGLAVCQQLRARSRTPIILLSGCGDDADVVKGLELGADDYIVKPFSLRQLVARVRAILRRAGADTPHNRLTVADLTLDRTRNEVMRPGANTIRLTPREASLLETLMLHAGEVLSNEQLISSIWGDEEGNRIMLKQLVYRLRLKLAPYANQSPRLESVPGLGYLLVTPLKQRQ